MKLAARLKELVSGRSTDEPAPSGGTYRGLTIEATRRIAEELGLAARAVEIAALENGIVPVRYHRGVASIGLEGQLKLRRAKAAVVGAGGLGGTLVEILARFGIGALVVIDGETFTEDNINRQVLCTEDGIGAGKAEAASARVARVNAAVDVEAHRIYIRKDNIDLFLRGCDLVIDALDSIPVRLILQEAAARLRIPFIHGAVAGFAGEVMTVMPGDAGLLALFGPGAGVPRSGVETEVGVPTVTPAVVAALEAMEAVKVITGRGTPIRNRLLCIDLDESAVTAVRIEAPAGEAAPPEA
ncbi:MAG: HesA/MoeB/ThiF family protein [bacterium]|nr:HesA/MoeB/ThiF family protein [bacterium]